MSDTIGSEDDTPAMGTPLSFDAPPHIMIVVAHSSKSKGVIVDNGGLEVAEYEISKRASIACARALMNDFQVTLHMAGPVPGATRYLPMKVAQVNGARPTLAIEIHCNAGPPHASYREVIFYPGSTVGAAAAERIASALTYGFPDWKPCRFRANSVESDKHLFYFLDKTKVPSLIVEGLFLTNPEHRERMVTEGGPEQYGLAVATGLRTFLEEVRKRQHDGSAG